MKLTITPVKSRLNKLTLKEPVDITTLNKLINSDLLKTTFNNKFSEALYENEKEQLIKYRTLTKNGYASVTYKQARGIHIGRVTPNKALGLFSIRREVRQTLAKNKLVDIDIENCHPQLLYQLCLYNSIKCKYLSMYVKNRDEYLNDIQDTYLVDRDTAKKLFLRLMYFGTFNSWRKDINNESPQEPTAFISKFQNELKTIGEIIVENNPEIKSLVEKRKQDKNVKSYNLKGSVCSYFLQEYENQILETIYDYCIQKGYIKDVGVLCADGLMIPKELYKPEILNEFHDVIKSKFGFDLTFTEKEMKQDYLSILDDHVLDGDATFKEYTPITVEMNIKQVQMSNKFVYDEDYKGQQLTPEIFDENSTIIIKSTTGTGKTTAIADLCKDTDKKIISIIPRISLANQHKDTFKKKNILLMSYLNDNVEKELNVFNDNIVICINSLLKLQYLPLDKIKNSIIYIDEVASFIESLTDNETLNRNLKKIHTLLMKLIKNAYKVVVSDAIINDGVFELLKHRSNDSKVFIMNDYIKYKNINAVRIKDENLFLDMVKQKITNNEPFLFPCDSCSTISKFYIDCLSISPEEFKDRFMLITADTKIKITDASKELKDKFVFYSPSITYGVDFQTEEPQDVFNYIKGESIQPSGFFQQTTRTRNIKTLYYYCEETYNNSKYNTLEDVKDHYRNIVNITNTNFFNICVGIDANDDETVCENTFFNLFCYNEFVKDTYETNKLKHFEELLKMNGFKLSDIGDDANLSKEENDRLNELKSEYDDKLFDEFISSSDEDRKQDKFIVFNEHIKSFHLYDKTNDELRQIKDCMSDKFYFKEVLNFNRLLKNEEQIINKISNIEKENYKFKCYNSPYHKIKIIFDICKLNDIKLLDFSYTSTQDINLPSELFNLYKVLYNSPKAKHPTNSTELIKLLVTSYKHLMPSLKLIKTDSTRLNESGKRTRVYKYSLDTDKFNELNKIISIYGFNKQSHDDDDDNFDDFDGEIVKSLLDL